MTMPIQFMIGTTFFQDFQEILERTQVEVFNQTVVCYVRLQGLMAEAAQTITTMKCKFDVMRVLMLDENMFQALKLSKTKPSRLQLDSVVCTKRHID